MAAFQTSLEGISKQIRDMQSEVKTDLRTFKDDITNQMSSELAELKDGIEQKFTKMAAEVSEQRGKTEAVLTRIEEVETWSSEANTALQEMMKEQRLLVEKLDDLESRSRRNNLRVYGIPEGAEAGSDSVAHFMDKLLREEFSLDTDLQIQRAHRALAPKPNPDLPPRSVVINFQQFSVKEMILKKAWGKKTVTLGGNRIYFDHDYSTRTLKQRKEYVIVKKTLKKEGIRFQTPLNKMRIHWPNGVKTYGSAEEATGDLRRRGYEVEDSGAGSGDPAPLEKLQSTGIAGWKNTRSNQTSEASRRARGRLEGFKHRDDASETHTRQAD